MAGATVKLNENTLAYEARPDSKVKAPGVVVIHEVTGLVDYIKDVTRSLAEQGYLALAVDLYEGKTASGLEEGKPIRDKITEAVFKAKIGAAIRYLKSSPHSTGQIGVMGFCMGGGFALWAACLFPEDFKACTVFYGRLENLELLRNLHSPVLGNFGAEDKGITTWAVEQFKPAMERLGKRLDMKVYPGAPHGFHRHTAPNVYRPEAAQDAFQRTLNLFAEALR